MRREKPRQERRVWGLGSFLDALAGRLSRVTSSEHLIPEVDGLRLMALMLVILHHSVAIYLETAQPLGPLRLPEEWSRAGHANRFFVLVSHLGFAIPMFFVLSGFVLSLPYLRAVRDGRARPSLKRFFLRRLTRMEPPYAIALLFTFTLLMFQGKPFGLFAKHLAASAVYLHAAIYGAPSWILGVAWTLEIDAQFYLALPILQWILFRKDRTTRRALLAGVILVGGIASQLYFDTPMVPPALNLSLVNWIQFFVAGFLLADLYLDYWHNRPASHPLYWDAAGLVCFGLIFAVVLQRPHSWLPWWMQRPWNGKAAAFLLPWLIIVAFAGVFRGPALKWLATRRWVVIGGGMSYTVYLYHYTLIELFIRPAYSIIGSSFSPVVTSILIFLLLLVPIFTVSAVLFLLVEKPFMRWRPGTPTVSHQEMALSSIALRAREDGV